MIHASTKAIRIGSWHGVEEPASSRLGTTTMEIDLLDSKTRLCSLGKAEAPSNLWVVLAKSGLFIKHAAMCLALLGSPHSSPMR